MFLIIYSSQLHNLFVTYIMLTIEYPINCVPYIMLTIEYPINCVPYIMLTIEYPICS